MQCLRFRTGFFNSHQPSIKILEEIARRIEMPFEKVKTNMDRYANTSGGTIPILLDELHRNNEFKTAYERSFHYQLFSLGVPTTLMLWGF